MRRTLEQLGQRLKMSQHRKAGEEGYTLMEMLVVIGVIALIAAVLTPSILGNMQRARSKTAQMQVQTIAGALETFRADVGRYPTSEESLSVLLAAPSSVEGWTGPYLKDSKYLQDPWGHSVIYTLNSDGQGFTVRSNGSDGVEGGTGAARDLIAP